MKKIFYLFFAVAMVLSSCGNDDDGGSDNGVKGKMQIGSENYNLKSGTIENYGESDDGTTYNFDIELYSEDINSIDDESSLTGLNISSVYFELWSENSSNLADGTYTYDDNYGQNAFTFTDSEITIDYSFFAEDGTYYEINSGEIEVSKNGSTYDITFEGTTSEGKDVSINYKGKLTAY